MKKSTVAILVAAAVAVFGGLLVLSRGEEAPSESDAAPDDDTEEHAAAPPHVAPRRPVPARPSARPRASVERSFDDNVVGPHPDDPHEPGMHPHPITPEHERIYAENRLIQELNDLMSFRKTKEMRERLAEYKKLDPEDIEKNQLGYEVIADCIEFPGEASLAAARHFYDTQRHSPLRRFVRRICFENSN